MSEGHTDFSAAFRDGAAFVDDDGRRLEVERLDVGMLDIDSGTIAIGDPISAMDPIGPPQGSVAPGRYNVDVCVIRYPSGDRYVAAARVTFRDDPINAWVASELVIPVDGQAAFADGRYEAGKMIGEISKALRASRANAFSQALVRGSGGQVAVFTSGTGGGEYSAFWGMTVAAEPAQLCLDFQLLTRQRTEEVELALPLRRGEVKSPGLARHGVRANVPLFASTTLKVTFRAPQFVTARWNTSGALEPVPTHADSGGLTFDLSAPPPGATLLLRIAVGAERQPLRVALGAR
jgi:hypothetical protein